MKEVNMNNKNTRNDGLEDLSKEMLIAKIRFISDVLYDYEQLKAENKALKKEISQLKMKNARGAGRKSVHSDKEKELRRLLELGKNQKTIAEWLDMSAATVSRMTKKINEEDREHEIVKACKEYGSVRDVADKFNMTIEEVSRIGRKHKIAWIQLAYENDL